MNIFKFGKIRPIHACYLLSLVGICILLLCIQFTNNHSYTDLTAPNFMVIDDDIRLSPDGVKSINLRKLGSYCEPDCKTLTLYYRLPELKKDTTLMYRSKDVYTSLYVDDTLIYQTSVPDSRFYNRSPGNLWNIVTLDESYSGALLSLNLDIVYDTSAITADSFYLGDGTNIILNYVHERLFAIFISMFIILIGVALIIIDFVTQNKIIQTGHALLYLGIDALLTGMWSFSETNTLQLFVSDQRILQLINNALMVAGTIPLLLYMDYLYNVFQEKFTRFFCMFYVTYIWICLLSQFIGIFDMHDLLIVSELSLLIGFVVFWIWIIYLYIVLKRKCEDTTPVVLQMIGLGALFTTTLLSLSTLITGDTADRAKFVRVGMLFFIIFLAISSQIQTNRLLAQGMEYNVIKNLAYKDGLTSLGNRTAYLERLEFYTHSDIPRIGIVYLDINNLKQVNDQQGHELGDKLIQTGASIIQNSFGIYGRAYRIGGDEFCVFIEDIHLSSIYQTAAMSFQNLIEEANKDDSFPVPIQIAHGFAICEDLTSEKLKNSIALADHAMYENKAQLKASTANN